MHDLYWQPRRDLAALGFLFPDLAEADRHLLQHHDEDAPLALLPPHASCSRANAAGSSREHLARHADRRSTATHERARRERAWLRAARASTPTRTSPPPRGRRLSPPARRRPSPGRSRHRRRVRRAARACAAPACRPNTRRRGRPPLWRETVGQARGVRRASATDRNAPLPTLIPRSIHADRPARRAPTSTCQRDRALASATDRTSAERRDSRSRWSGVLLVERAGRLPVRGRRAHRGGRAAEHRARRALALERDAQPRRSANGCCSATAGRGSPTPHPRPSCTCAAARTTSPSSSSARAATSPIPTTSAASTPASRSSTPVRTPTSELITIPRTRLYIGQNDRPRSTPIRSGRPRRPRWPPRTSSTLTRHPPHLPAGVPGAAAGRPVRLSARRHEDGQSELGYHARASRPLRRNVVPPRRRWLRRAPSAVRLQLPAGDRHLPAAGRRATTRAAPSLPRQAALFDWWERLFDYTRAAPPERRPSRRAPTTGGCGGCSRRREAANPADVLQLPPHLDVELDHNDLVQRYCGLISAAGQGRADRGEPARRAVADPLPGRRSGVSAALSPALHRPASSTPGRTCGRPMTRRAGAPSGNDNLTQYVQTR